MRAKLVNSLLDASFVIPQRVPLGGKRSIPLRIAPLKPPRYNIFFMGATNRPQVLDEAVTRPGRFGRQISSKCRTWTIQGHRRPYFARIRHDRALDSPELPPGVRPITKGYSPR